MQLCLPKTLPKLPSIINSAHDLWNFRYIVSSHVGKQAGSFNSLSTFWRPSSSHTIKNFSNALDFVPHVTKMSKRQAWYAYARCKFESASVWIRDEMCFWQFLWEYFEWQKWQVLANSRTSWCHVCRNKHFSSAKQHKQNHLPRQFLPMLIVLKWASELFISSLVTHISLSTPLGHFSHSPEYCNHHKLAREITYTWQYSC